MQHKNHSALTCQLAVHSVAAKLTLCPRILEPRSYVFWNFHQRELSDYTSGKYDYSGRGNVTAFLQAAKDANLFVIWRFGG